MKLEENSNTTLFKVKFYHLNTSISSLCNSNTTLVKVKWKTGTITENSKANSNTTLVKVKFNINIKDTAIHYRIQIQHLLKLNGDK